MRWLTRTVKGCSSFSFLNFRFVQRWWKKHHIFWLCIYHMFRKQKKACVFFEICTLFASWCVFSHKLSPFLKIYTFIDKPVCGLPYCTRCLIVNPPPPSLMGIDKKATFPPFPLFFFTFAPWTKKITFFFVKNLTKTCRKNWFFTFSP